MQGTNTKERKVVYNADFGAFMLSPLARDLYYKRKYGKSLTHYLLEDYKEGGKATYRRVKIEEVGSRHVTSLSEDFGDVFTVELYKNADPLTQKYNRALVFLDDKVKRHDPILVGVVEELGQRAGDSLKVKIINSRAYKIEDWDGKEEIIEADMEDWYIIDDDD
ncbi:MAG: hypothetical protein J6I84_04120 [Bacilli bacterium]|nr:hypothetical protein [Bacilli bacterium]